ncbi:MAG TPA: hypothetical protein VKH41_11080 [Myxococcota bacterium]|nr:hypothetical protein [Myxococcota bacterium]
MVYAKSSLRFTGFAIAGAIAVMLVGTAVGAATYSMTGKAATGSGAFVDLPALGNVPCLSITGKIGFGGGYYPAKKTQTKLIGPLPQNPGGCIPGGALRAGMTPAVVNVNGTGGFTVPAGFFNQPFPGGTKGGTPMNLQVTPVPNVPQIIQLATSFKFEGPPAAPFSMLNPVNTKAAYAVWRRMRHGAYATQTGRIAKNFTACAAAHGKASQIHCTFPSSGLVPAIIKNIGGPGTGFGGTMGLVLTTSPTQQSSLAVQQAGGFVAFVIVGGMGSRAAGRGYAAYDTDFLPGGQVFSMYTLTNMKAPPYNLIGMVTGYKGMGPTATNMNWGFPFTTGQIIVRGTGGNGMGGAVNATVTAKGFDTVTGMGNRNIQLVAGGVAQSTVQGPNGTPNYTILRLPEPGGVMQLFAGVAGLLTVAVWRGRKAR